MRLLVAYNEKRFSLGLGRNKTGLLKNLIRLENRNNETIPEMWVNN